MSDNAVILDTVILTVCYLLMTIALMTATIWIYRLRMRIRELERKNRKD